MSGLLCGATLLERLVEVRLPRLAARLAFGGGGLGLLKALLRLGLLGIEGRNVGVLLSHALGRLGPARLNVSRRTAEMSFNGT